MYTLFLFSLFAFGVFVEGWFPGYEYITMTWYYPINATLTPTSRILEYPEYYGHKSNYTTLTYHISETLDTSSVTGLLSYSPRLYLNSSDSKLIDFTDLVGPFSAWSSSGRLEPCGNHFLSMPLIFNLTSTTQSEDTLEGRGELDIIVEDSLVRIWNSYDSPYEEYFTGDGMTIYRTLEMDLTKYYDEYVVPTNLLIRISTFSVPVSSVIPTVIFATGDQCIETYSNSNPEDRIVKSVPENVKSFEFTVPAKTIWYVGLRSLKQPNEVKVEYELLYIYSAASFIPSLDLQLMIVSFLLSFIVYHQ
jgi:hypothetical protein